MKINRDNYESFFLDYHEGVLDSVRVKELFEFLAQHPDLKKEFDDFEMLPLESEPSQKFNGKDGLKKQVIHPGNAVTWLIAREEGDLDAGGQKEVEQFLELNPGYRRELEIIRQTRLLPEYKIVFQNKSSLKKGTRIVPMWVRYAAAACVAGLVVGYWVLKPEVQNSVATNSGKGSQFTVHSSQQQPNPGKQKEAVNPMNGNEKTMEQKKSRTVYSFAATSKVKTKKSIPVTKYSVPLYANQSQPPIISSVEEKEQPLPVTQVNVQEKELPVIIYANQDKANVTEQEFKRQFEVLDSKDLAELGLKNVPVDKPGLKASAAEVGKLLGMRSHYSVKENLLEQTSTETFALGPIEITEVSSR